MIIENFNMYLDGGTIEIITNKGTYCFDDRIRTTTKGALYNGVPKGDNSNIIENSNDLEKEIIEALKVYKNDFYQTSIDYFINFKTNKIMENKENPNERDEFLENQIKTINKNNEIKKCQEIFILMNLAKMTLTEINTLSDSERNLLCIWFKEQNDREGKSNSKYFSKKVL